MAVSHERGTPVGVLAARHLNGATRMNEVSTRQVLIINKIAPQGVESPSGNIRRKFSNPIANGIHDEGSFLDEIVFMVIASYPTTTTTTQHPPPISLLEYVPSSHAGSTASADLKRPVTGTSVSHSYETPIPLGSS